VRDQEGRCDGCRGRSSALDDGCRWVCHRGRAPRPRTEPGKVDFFGNGMMQYQVLQAVSRKFWSYLEVGRHASVAEMEAMSWRKVPFGDSSYCTGLKNRPNTWRKTHLWWKDMRFPDYHLFGEWIHLQFDLWQISLACMWCVWVRADFGLRLNLTWLKLGIKLRVKIVISIEQQCIIILIS
jgi:hypothetical protein